MTNIVTSSQMYAAEKNAVSRGVDFPELMERAGNACAKIIYDEYCGRGNVKALVLCGKGKNGGDGFVIARVLQEKGADVKAALLCSGPSEGDQLANYLLLQKTCAVICDCTGDINALKELISEADIIIDALFGTGFRGSLPGFLADAAKAVNSSCKTVIAVDVPSGVNCDTCEIQGEVFEADMTIAISAFKPVHITKPYNSVCGKVRVADLGIIDSDYDSDIFTLDIDDIRSLLPERKADSNKGTFGHALCVCGSYKMPGAAYMSVSGALRTGAGLVTAAFPQSAYSALAVKLTEALLLPCGGDKSGMFSPDSLPELTDALKKASSALIGCGLGLCDDTADFVKSFLRQAEIPLVIDADALNAVSADPSVLREIKAPFVITPHPGEMSRLTGKTVDEIVSSSAESAREFAKEYNCTVVLKGANTVVCDEGGRRVYVNRTGNNGLSKGGSGDLLAGMLVSLIAQGMNPFDAACAAVFMHGDCADRLAAKTSKRGMLVTDMIAYLPEYLGKFE